MPHRVTRRYFLMSTAAGIASAKLLKAGPSTPSPSERVNVAFIGADGKGRDDQHGVAGAGGEIVALCEVDARRFAQADKEYPGRPHYTDFRKMLDKQKDIDAVCVSIPDHQHAFAAMTAMQHGKHVYCQKPLTHDIAEARMLRETASKRKLATQMGNQGHASEGLRQQVDWIKAGVLGPVREVHVWTNRPIWPQGINRPEETPPVPEGLDWDLWLGTAPLRAYNPAYHPFKWRGFYDFGTGALGDMACHIVDPAFWALNLSGPCTVEAKTEGATQDSYPNWSIITWEFPARGALPPVKMTWYDGGKMPPRPKKVTDYEWSRMKGGGLMYVGDKGTMIGGNTRQGRILGELGKDLKPPDRTIPKSPGHYREWLDACRGGPAALSNFDYAAALTETVLLGNIALRSGQKIEWDPTRMKVTNVPEANQFIRREYRKGWEVVPA